MTDNLEAWHTPPSQKIYHAARGWNAAQHRYVRLHGGVDIYTQEHAEVYACAAGKVVEYRDRFATGRDNIQLAALAIEHTNTPVGKIIVRYCEMDPGAVPTELKTLGATVTARQIIGKTWPVIDVDDCMLHLETYRGTHTGDLSRPNAGELANITYKGRAVSQTQALTTRRADQINPYDFLIACLNNSPE
ncbi:MAG: M23 family metallopeptidase [Candidatus Accumulibacter sp.]|jgi:hypothetical protein|nr:M23 family metallopeptidase [Accumulibacter sp.]